MGLLLVARACLSSIGVLPVIHAICDCGCWSEGSSGHLSMYVISQVDMVTSFLRLSYAFGLGAGILAAGDFLKRCVIRFSLGGVLASVVRIQCPL